MYQENMKRKEVRPEFHCRRPSEDANLAPPLSTSCSPVTISILERSENFGQILANVSGEHKAKGGMPWISSSKAVRRRCAATSNSSPPWILSLRRRYIVPPLSISCSPVTISILERSENFGQILANVSQENMKRKEVSPEFHRQRPFENAAPLRFSPIVIDFSVTRYSRVFFIPYENTRDVKPRPNSTMNVPVDCRFPRSLPISLTPCIVGYFSPLRKVFWTWNRIQWVQWMYPLIADFPRSLPIFQSPGIVGYFSSLMKILGTWNRVQIVQWTYPLIADFPRSMPISLTPCIVGYFSPLRKVFWTWNRIQWVQWMYHLIADFPRSLPIFQSPGIVGYFYPLWKYSGRETASK